MPRKGPAAKTLQDFDRPSVTVDLVLLTLVEGVLNVLLVRRDEAPSKGRWALPGGFVHIDESVDEAVERVLEDKARLPGAFVEQLYTFGAVARDPRGRVISIAHYALFDRARILAQTDGLALFPVVTRWDGETGGSSQARGADGAVFSLPFDHDDILGLAVKRLRGKLNYTAVGLELLPDQFPLRALQQVHEAILGHALTKPAFRRRMLDRGYLEPTGEREAAGAFRPAELYRRARPHDATPPRGPKPEKVK